MKNNYRILIAVGCLSVTLFAFTANSKKAVDPDRDKLLLELLTFVIEKGHYNPAVIDNNFSKGVYKDYIAALDPSKRFFLQSDINEFSKFELELDDQLTNKDLTFFNLTYDRLMLRMEESSKIYKDILNTPFDYRIEEDFNVDYDKASFAKNTAELKEKWRKQIKLTTLSSLTDKQKLEVEKRIKNPVYVMKSDVVLEKETRDSSLESLNDSFGFMYDLKRDDWFTLYINSIMSQFDPHTSYFAPEEKERFDTSMSGKFEGIGAQLQKKNDYIEISELISGGPAWRGKQLEKGDLIMKVAQSNGVAVDIVGMRLTEVIKKIKGPKGSEVRLTVKKTDGTIQVISIIRDIIEIEETYVKSSVVEKNGLKYGIIYLPKFYIDFENKDRRDAGKDVALEVDRLKQSGVNGIVLDVRDDGGGSLSTVVNIAGLFIEEGPIVQIKTASKKKEILYDTDKEIKWDGPLVIMVNEFSASASEILAAAIQDYKRGIIVGSKQTYGKGTVQRVIDLNQYAKNSVFGDFGALKTTIQKFYRITGGSTQLDGVSSDIIMPDRYAYLKMGERDEAHALPWDKIDPTAYTVWNNTSKFEQAIINSKKRIEKDIYFQLIEENAKWIDSRSGENNYSLNIDKFKGAQNQIEETSKKFKPIVDYKNNLIFTSLPYELEGMTKDLILKEKRERWHENLSKDIYVEEALNVLDDLQPKSIVKTIIPIDKKGKLVKR
ncbi:carboxy terminal-processing peptidase [Flavobacterium taihuense]|uniref:Carboxy terminal-processing peptidase n=1 Tax=Flavobacterium taihuense TaxID=2857508 RepID=A0ABS6XRI9_9FLAO|nr:carboxy terminal-processing peptidase [Flavobacterium taihuense]MBW4359290.1 carboxy terminal-processing peptidase [Flavobacterium taihuense]